MIENEAIDATVKKYDVQYLPQGYLIIFGTTQLVVSKDGVTVADQTEYRTMVNRDTISWGLLDELRDKLEATNE